MKFNYNHFFEEMNRILRERYARLYGGQDCNRKIEKLQKDLFKKICIVFIAFVLIFGFSLLKGEPEKRGLETDKQGRLISVERPSEKAESLRFVAKVYIYTKDDLVEKEVPVSIESFGKKEKNEVYIKEEEDEARIDRDLNRIISEMNRDTEQKKIKFPTNLENGEKILWEQSSSSNLPILFIGLALSLFGLYKSRFSSIKKEEHNATQSVIRELPEFINRLVLQLNAGMVFHSAFLKIIEDRREINKNENYFYEQMDIICKGVTETNESLHTGLKEFAKRSGIREMMLVSNIIGDNIGKGTDLVEKLQKESQLLWFSRKQQSEEKGRLAESKLTMPLVILLLVLIMVTIAPALLGM